jgi:cytochrome c-type biogenesis protein CcmH/NrfF
VRIASLVAAIVLGLAPAASAGPQDDANYISEHIMSPFCPGVTLHDCPSDSAVALRDRITEMATDGFTRAQIMDELVREFGETIRAEPPRAGSGLLAWVLPVVAVAGAAWVAWSLMRRWALVPATPSGYDPDVHVTETDRKRLDRELDRLRREK